MTSRQRVIRALEHQPVDRIPFDNPHPACRQFYNDVERASQFTYGKGFQKGVYGKKGTRLDNWGCEWQSGEDGVAGEIKHALIQDINDLGDFQPPWRVLDQADLSGLNAQCRGTDRFVMAAWDDISAQPFQRMQYLRGTEQLFMDMAMEEPGFFKLLSMVHSYYVRQAKMWCETPIDAIHIEDDWGTQYTTLISPDMWRKYFKPLYREYAEIAHRAGKKIVMHSDGYTFDLMEDLIEVGIDALNLQLFCMDMEEIGRRFGGRVAFWGEIDRQYLLPFGTDDEIRAGVRKVKKALLDGRDTGVVAMSFEGKDISDRALLAVYGEWMEICREKQEANV